MSRPSEAAEISDWDFILSSIGNAFFSGLSFKQTWDCVVVSEDREQLDAAIASCIELNDIVTKQGSKAK